MRGWYRLLLFTSLAAGCSDSGSEPKVDGLPKNIADDLKARGIETAAPKPVPPPAAAEFKPYTSPDGLFRVNFPGEPRVGKLSPSIPDKLSAMESYIVERKPRGYSVLVSHFDETRDAPQELEKLVKRHVSRALEGKLAESKDITLKKRPGKDIIIVDDDRARRARLIIDGKLVYQVAADLPADEAEGESAKAFLESFELLKD